MREIKFRGKQKHGKEWLYGWLQKHGNNYYIFPDEALNSADYYEVDLSTIGEFTGLQDKNGNDIYEGDILSKKWEAVVYACNKRGTWMVKFTLNPHINKPTSLFDYLRARRKAGVLIDNEITGNIHE